MTELLTAAQMRAIEEAAIASGEVTGLDLMERAGRGVVEAIFGEWPELRATSHRAVVLCGPGNNGGDGFVVARLLKEWGWELEVFLYGDPEKLPPDARVNYERWVGIGEVKAYIVARDETCLDTEVLIDALFGTGLTRAIDRTARGILAMLTESHDPISELSQRRLRTVSIDVQSGFDADSGHLLEEQPPKDWYEGYWSDLTVTFERARVGHFLLADPNRYLLGRPTNGRLVVKSIGLDRHVSLNEDEVVGVLATLPWTYRSQLEKQHLDHKYTHGHALVLSGGAGKGGAARLAARGALRIGAGLVTVGCPPEALVDNAARLDAVMLRPVADADAFGRELEDKRITALCLGPGLGTGDHGRGLVARALAVPDLIRDLSHGDGDPGAGAGTAVDVRRALVLDADALTILARDPDLFAALHPNCVLTPHAGEFARLFPDIAEKLAAPATKGPAYSKVDATREAAKRAGCVVLYKGPDTVIADPTGRCSINSAHYDRAAPWLATAGSGDVLAGFIAGLL
ncbi:MAG: NAD(P)H-hydrate epimerase, partial [Albidovulum sp.]|uniref:NAD(P)H-hydrate epimerase n=1 Tax=Albidovulum sp. TaxID=1872424 RepID=UPI003CAC2825